MKSLKCSVLLLAIGLSATSLTIAQDDAKKGEGRRGKDGQASEGRGRGQMMNADARVAQLDRALTLTADQKTKIKAVYAKSEDEMRAMMRAAKDGGGDQSAMREKMQSLRQSSQDQVRALLTDEQKKKFDDLPQPGRGEGRGRGEGKGGDAKGGDGKGGRGKKQ